MKARNWPPATTALGLNRRDSAVATVVLPAPGGPVTTMRSATPTMMPAQPPRTPPRAHGSANETTPDRGRRGAPRRRPRTRRPDRRDIPALQRPARRTPFAHNPATTGGGL